MWITATVFGERLASTQRETHAVLWTVRIAAYYTLMALLVSCLVYHVGLLIF